MSVKKPLKGFSKNLISTAKSFIKENEGVVDVILFGSSVKGSLKPHDLDLLVLFSREADSRKAFAFEKKLRKLGVNADVKAVSWKDLFKESFLARQSILSEGVSVTQGKKLVESFGFDSFTLFTYSLNSLNSSEQVRFHYALRGRNKPGILKEVNGVKLSRGTIIIPMNYSNEFQTFLESWNLEFKRINAFAPTETLKLIAK